VSVARSASRQRCVAPEQTNASDPLKRGSHQSRVCGRMIGGVMPHRIEGCGRGVRVAETEGRAG
jgi:hypothetical protein